MNQKKTVGKKPIQSRLSRTARMLAGTLRASLETPPPDEPRWNKQPKSNKGRKQM